MSTQYQTIFGSLENYEKGGVEVINDNAKTALQRRGKATSALK